MASGSSITTYRTVCRTRAIFTCSRWRAIQRLGLGVRQPPNSGVMAAPVTLGDSLQVGAPQMLFEACVNLSRVYAPHPSGERFLLVCPADRAAKYEIAVLVNWQSALN